MTADTTGTALSSETSVCEKLFASYPGASAMARIAPLRGSSTIAVASLAPHCCTVERSTCSAFAWMRLSSVVKRSWPSRSGCSVRQKTTAWRSPVIFNEAVAEKGCPRRGLS